MSRIKTPTVIERMDAAKRIAATAASLPQAPDSVTPEQWWTRHAELLAQKMKLGGVKSFRIDLTERGTYAFEVTPIESPNHDSNSQTTESANAERF